MLIGMGSERIGEGSGGCASLEAEELRTRNERGNERFILGHRETA